MIFNIILISLINIFVSSCVLWILLNRGVKLWQAIKLNCTASALNKLFLTSSGYAVMSWKMKYDDFPLSKSIPAFSLFELFSAAPWLISGVYFGARAAIKIPPFLMAVTALILFFAIYKRRKVKYFIRDVLNYLKETSFNVPLIIPLVLTNVMLGVAYYFFLLRAFGVTLPVLEVFKIISISVTVGYLSPAPSGLGFKEGSLVFLLMQNNLSLKSALSIAVTDRLITTITYAILGFSLGAKMVKNTLKERFKK